MKRIPGLVPLGLLALVAAACTNPYDPTQRAVGGGLIGAGTGAAIGGMAGGGRGAAIGALAGGLGGAAIGAATTPQQPAPYQGGYGQGYPQQQSSYMATPAPVGATTYYPSPGPGYVSAPYYQPPPPPPQAYQPPPGSYWQPQPYYAQPDPHGYYGY
ncbi:YMGG-like glycine zipper-containing protein [Neoroseomonas eburnea]|uniref:YMGG-like glycine zipper-containing protein n=1 Tax=Neoroseomonas eburnea TaxID=1346889 RepID=UPI001FE2BBE6|nr:YMGG-like glycine zipper-containing protein [Neoroseomonas eburnea]